jgi:hypothetical protein
MTNLFLHIKRTNWSSVMLIFLTILMLSTVTYSSADASKPLTTSPYAVLAEKTSEQSKPEIALLNFCESASIQPMFTRICREKEGMSIDPNNDPELVNSKLLVTSLSNIASRAAKEEFGNPQLLAIVAQLEKLEDKLLSPRPMGTVNVALANCVSALRCGLFFQAVAKSEASDLKSISLPSSLWPQIKQDALKELMFNEAQYSPGNINSTLVSLLVNMVETKCSDEIRIFKDKNHVQQLTPQMIPTLVWTANADSARHRSPLVEFNSIRFVSDYMSIRTLEIWNRFSVPYKQFSNEISDRRILRSQFKDYILRELTIPEKEILGNPQSEDQINKMCLEISSGIERHLKQNGKTILITVVNRCSVLNSAD